MMGNIIRAFALIALVLALFGCEEVNLNILADAGRDAARAATLSAEDVRMLSEQSRKQLDSKHQIAEPGNPYYDRMFSLVSEKETFENITYDIQVYIKPQVNAFALPDGSIRIFSGLMDMLDDDELLFVVGHEMGHVYNEDTLDKMRVAYGTRAVQKGLASIKGDVGQVSASWVGDLSNRLVNSQFSQQEERDADDYGLYYVYRKGLDLDASVSALRKLETLGSDHTFLSTHPEPGNRADRLEQQIAQSNGTIQRPQELTQEGKRFLNQVINRTGINPEAAKETVIDKVSGLVGALI